jgi:phage shock protein PspC (stress-responsive transcriptional regulator)
MEKKFQRDTQHKVIGGVCAGLANYFDIDATLLRLLLAFLILFAGTGFWLYIILWIVMPAGRIEPSSDGVETFVPETTQEPKNNRGSMIVGLTLIGLGALGLLHRFVPEFNWQMVWPIALIVLGLVLILPKAQKS